MRVLFLAADGVHDYLQDVVLHGLVDVLGAENVFVAPDVARFHEQPGNLRHNAMMYPELPPLETGPVDELAAAADAVVVGAARGTALHGLDRLLELRVRKPTALLDGRDDPYVRTAIRHVDVYFKRETLVHSARLRLRFPLRRAVRAFRPDPMLGRMRGTRRQVAVAHAGVRKLVPLPFAVIPKPFPRAETTEYDVAFLGTATDPLRVRVADELRASGLRVAVPAALDDGERTTWTDYMRTLSASRIGISVRGAGFDTFRYWEIPYAGALLLAETPRTVIPRNFEDGREAVFAEPDDLVAAARRMLDRDDIAAAGNAAVHGRHLSRHRGETVLERLS